MRPTASLLVGILSLHGLALAIDARHFATIAPVSSASSTAVAIANTSTAVQSPASKSGLFSSASAIAADIAAKHAAAAADAAPPLPIGDGFITFCPGRWVPTKPSGDCVHVAFNASTCYKIPNTEHGNGRNGSSFRVDNDRFFARMCALYERESCGGRQSGYGGFAYEMSALDESYLSFKCMNVTMVAIG